MNLLPVARFKRRFQHAYTRVLQLQRGSFWVHDQRILCPCDITTDETSWEQWGYQDIHALHCFAPFPGAKIPHMQQTRRQFLRAAGGFAVSCSLLRETAFGQQKTRTRVILLGTKGGPRVAEAGRSNPSTLILIDDVPYLVDCGYGTSRQLLSAGVALNRLRYIFITHHHSDHNLEFGPLLYNAWITGLPT